MPTPKHWTIVHNERLSDRYSDVYTLYYQGLVRGQLPGLENADRICAALNVAQTRSPVFIGKTVQAGS